MAKVQQRIAVTERTAANMLEIKPSEFRRLVDRGSLPRPRTIAGELQRWSVAELNAIMDGSAIDDEFET
nr:hypothetical protein [uncultured Celeribacter sp.]